MNQKSHFLAIFAKIWDLQKKFGVWVTKSAQKWKIMLCGVKTNLDNVYMMFALSLICIISNTIFFWVPKFSFENWLFGKKSRIVLKSYVYFDYYLECNEKYYFMIFFADWRDDIHTVNIVCDFCFNLQNVELFIEKLKS